MLAAVGYKMSPIYRGLTFQFKVYASPRNEYSERFSRRFADSDGDLGIYRCPQ